MKKRKLKKWVRLAITFMLLFIISLIFVELANARANQINRSMKYETINN